MASGELSRRALLLGGAGALAVAGCGTTEKLPPEGPTFRSGSFRSSERGGARTGYSIAWPKGHAGESLPVVVALHGRGGSHRRMFAQLHADRVLDRLVAGGTAPFAVASVDGGEASYWHRRADGTDAAAMITKEFLPLLHERGLETDRVGLYGWSMGGFGALLLAGRGGFPARAVAVSSPALFTSAGSTAAGAFDDAEDFDANDVFGHPEWLRGRHLRIDCGQQDPFYPATHHFVEQLDPTPAGGFIRGAHNATYWRQVLPDQLKFLGERVGS